MTYTYHTTRDDDDEGTFVFAHHNEKMVGHLHVPDEEIGHKHWRIGDIYVDEKHRRRGVGTSMINHMSTHIGSKPSGASSVFTPDGKALYSSLKEWVSTKFRNLNMLDASKVPKGTAGTLVGNIRGGGKIDIQTVMDNDGQLVTPFSRTPIKDIQDKNGEMHLSSPKKPRPPGAKVKSSGHRIHTVHESYIVPENQAPTWKKPSEKELDRYSTELDTDSSRFNIKVRKKEAKSRFITIHHKDSGEHIGSMSCDGKKILTVHEVTKSSKEHPKMMSEVMSHLHSKHGYSFLSSSTMTAGMHKTWEELAKNHPIRLAKRNAQGKPYLVNGAIVLGDKYRTNDEHNKTAGVEYALHAGK